MRNWSRRHRVLRRRAQLLVEMFAAPFPRCRPLAYSLHPHSLAWRSRGSARLKPSAHGSRSHGIVHSLLPLRSLTLSGCADATQTVQGVEHPHTGSRCDTRQCELGARRNRSACAPVQSHVVRARSPPRLWSRNRCSQRPHKFFVRAKKNPQRTQKRISIRTRGRFDQEAVQPSGR